MAFRWRDNFRVNHPELDQQHRKLFEIGNRLYELASISDGYDRFDEIMLVMTELEDYTVEHFHDEERIMAENNHPDLAEHKQIHDNFVAKLRSIHTDDIDLRQKAILNELLVFVADWISDHILKDDMEYARKLGWRLI